MVTKDLNRGKGLVFDYSEKMGESSALSVQSNPDKLLGASLKAHSALSVRSAPVMKRLCYDKDEAGSADSVRPNYPTVFQTGSSKSGYSGVVKKKQPPRKRPPKSASAEVKGNKRHRCRE